MLQRTITALKMDAGTMLEVGCSYGSMLRRFRDIGWSTTGIEWDARAAEAACQEESLDVRAGSVEDIAPTLGRTFDIVLGSHVIEHALDPHRFLSSLATIMRPGSTLILRTPNSRSLAARLCRGWWQWAVAPEHVHLFSTKSLDRLVAGQGYTSVRCDYRRGDANTTLFELVHSAGKLVLGNTDDGRAEKLSATGPRPLSSGPLFQGVRALLNFVGSPLELAARNAPLPVRSGLPELLLIARKNA